MAESRTHQNLVMAMKDWLISENNNDINIFTDLLEDDTNSIPKLIYGYRPDLYAVRISDDKQYIGEAKTKKDLEKNHSRKQLRAFLEYLSGFENSILILGVPWAMVPCAIGLIKSIQLKSNTTQVHFKVLDMLPG